MLPTSSKIPGKLTSKEQDINTARKRGVEVETRKKFEGGRNLGARRGPANAAAIEADDISTAVPTVTVSFAQALQKARVAKKWTQADLARAINEKPSVVNDYEAGRAIPNGQVVGNMSRALGVSLPKASQKIKKPTPD